MTKQEKAIQTIRTEIQCVKNVDCERLECRNCQLVMPEHDILEALEMAIKALEQQTEDVISRQTVNDKLTTLINELEMIFSDIREKNVDDSVCGLCEYDCDHGIDGFANECPGFEKDDCFRLKDEIRKEWMQLPSVQPKQKTGEWIPVSERLPEEAANKVQRECPYDVDGQAHKE